MGKSQRDKGSRTERNLVNLFRSWGLEAYRVPLSGATDHSKGDVDVYRTGHCKGEHAPLIIECKARKDGFKRLYQWLGEHDMVMLKADNKERLFVIPERVLRELL